MPTYDLGLEHVSLAFATKNIFTDVTQGVFEGDRIGIVGKNGDGKSTLLHLFKGTQEPDSGRVTMRNGLTFGMLDQRDPLDDNATVREAALEGREDYEWAAETRSREIVEALLGGTVNAALELAARLAAGNETAAQRLHTLMVADATGLCGGAYVVVARSTAAQADNRTLQAAFEQLLTRAGALPLPAAAGTMPPADSPASPDVAAPQARPETPAQ